MNRTQVSTFLLIASLVLLIIYGADEATESSEKRNGHAESSEANESPEQRAAEEAGTIKNKTPSEQTESVKEKHEERRGFLPLSEGLRGSVFGGGAIVMSIIGFVISRKEYSPILSALLLINGGVLIAIVMTDIFNGSASSELAEGGNSSNEFQIIGSAIVAGAIVLVGLGILKLVTNRKIIKKRNE